MDYSAFAEINKICRAHIGLKGMVGRKPLTLVQYIIFRAYIQGCFQGMSCIYWTLLNSSLSTSSDVANIGRFMHIEAAQLCNCSRLAAVQLSS